MFDFHIYHFQVTQLNMIKYIEYYCLLDRFI